MAYRHLLEANGASQLLDGTLMLRITISVHEHDRAGTDSVVIDRA